MQNQESGRKKIFFLKDRAKLKKLEEDIMLAFTKILQKARKLLLIQVSKIGYLQLDAILALLTEKADARELLKISKNIFIKVAKTVDIAVIGAEILEYWHCFKMYRMHSERYHLGKRENRTF